MVRALLMVVLAPGCVDSDRPSPPVDVGSMRLMDRPLADFPPVRVEVGEDVVLTVRGQGGRVSVLFESALEPGTSVGNASTLAATDNPAVVSGGVSNGSEASSPYSYCFGVARRDITHLDVSFGEAEGGSARTVAVPGVPGLRAFAIEVAPDSFEIGPPTFVAQLVDGSVSAPFVPSESR